MIGIFKKRLPRQCNFNVAGQRIALTEISKLAKFPPERALVSSGHAVCALRAFGRPGPRVLERGRASVVVHEVTVTFLRKSYLPAWWQSFLQGAHFLTLLTNKVVFANILCIARFSVPECLSDLCAWVLPLRGAILVVDIVDASVGLHAALPAGGQRAQRVVGRG